MNTRSLSFRLVTWYAGVLTLVFVVLGSLTLIFLRHYLESAVLDTQARRARQIADTLIASVDRTGEAVHELAQVEELYSPVVNDRFIRITRDGGGGLYVSGPPHDGTFVPADVPTLGAAAFDRAGVFERKVALPSGSLLIGAVASRHYVVEVGVSTARTEETLQQVLSLLAVGLPIGVLIAVSGGFVLVRRALKPVISHCPQGGGHQSAQPQ